MLQQLAPLNELPRRRLQRLGRARLLARRTAAQRRGQARVLQGQER